ncbi:hypothetical protein ASE21_19140 [Flavobacterium sp. Root901]|uniref:DUF2652 domain-containing protein n=1 Tax=Flavobacterium sp. Root901 TaxID=1736605 RepID=UPI00070950B3|nr:DUF2652 domain-containing protein [Flavobacterium sp. Root901]KRD07598.1 hypothetical protein ASE21_19140 [Flavobacterium sp. Root901]
MIDNHTLLENYLKQSKYIKAGNGIVIIPDISGFTEFVSTICLEAGRYITYELLSTLIECNTLDMQISEIEGDAVLFYKFGDPPSLSKILNQYEIMLKAFTKKLHQIEEIVGHKLGLSLKLIAHYGDFSEYNIGGFKKLYGQTIVQSHKLLKNSIKSNTYVLLTNEMRSAANYNETIDNKHKYPMSYVNQVYSYYDYQ